MSINKIHIVTVATESRYYFPYLNKTCEENGKQLKVLGFKQKWKGFNWRFKLVLMFLKTLPLDDVVCFVDGWDVICTRNLGELRDEFIKIKNRENCKLIVSYDHYDYSTLLNKIYVENFFKKCNNISLNAGLYMGYVSDLIDIVSQLQKINKDDSADDQILLTKFCDMNRGSIYIDVNFELFLTFDKPFFEIDDYLAITNDKKVYYKGKRPFFIHGPGQTYLDNTLKKLGYNDVNVRKQLSAKFGKREFWYKNSYTIISLICLISIITILYLILRFT
jgi:hypothetical protein